MPILVTTLVLATGKGLFLSTIMVYLLVVAKLGTLAATAAWSLWGAASVLVSIPVGMLLDRVSGRMFRVAAASGAAMLLAAVAYTREPVALLLVLTLGGAFDSAANVARRALLASGTGDPVAALAWARTVSNIGFALGGLLAAWLLSDPTRAGFRLGYLGVAVGYLLLAAFFATTSLRRAPTGTAERPQPQHRGIRNLRLGVTLATATGILYVHSTLLTTIMPLWVTRFTDVPVWAIGWLIALNAVLVIVAQIPVSRRASTAPGAVHCMRRSTLWIAACCALLGTCRYGPIGWQVAALVAATVTVTFGELLQAAGEWGLAATLAGDREHGFFQAACVFGESAQAALGPVLLGTLITALPVLGWPVLIAVAGLGRVVTGFLASPEHRPTLAALASPPPT